MKHLCPCCHQEFNPPVLEETEDMGNLFSCDHCQSVLKWENQSLKVVYESQNEPSVSPSASSVMESLSEQLNEDIISELTEEEKEVSKEKAPEEDMIDDLTERDDSVEKSELVEEDISYEEQPEEVQEKSSSEVSESVSKQDNILIEEAEFIKEEETHQDFSDVEEYGNAQATSEKGFLRYDLRIAGVDSTEIEQQILSILEDPRFHWDAKEIMQSQKEGILVIKNLNPIKAMCLVSDLSFLSVELSWEQYMALNVSKEPVES